MCAFCSSSARHKQTNLLRNRHEPKASKVTTHSLSLCSSCALNIAAHRLDADFLEHVSVVGATAFAGAIVSRKEGEPLIPREASTWFRLALAVLIVATAFWAAERWLSIASA